MVTSDSTFFSVRQSAEYAETGWHVRVLSRDFATVVAEISDFIELSITKELSNVGAGSIVLDEDSPLWGTTLADGLDARHLRNYDYLWQAYEDGVLRFEWLGMNCQNSFVAEDGSRTVTISGPGSAQILTWAKVFPPGYPSLDPTVEWPYTASTPTMQIFLNLLAAAQDRGTIPWITPLFNASTDSGGKTWDDVAHPYTDTTPYAPELGSDLLTQLNIATGQDLNRANNLRAEWVMHPGFKLDVQSVIGTRKDSTVIFFTPIVFSNERISTREDVANMVVIRDDYGAMSQTMDSASITAFNRREELRQQGNLTDNARRSAVAFTVLDQKKDAKQSWSIQVPYRSDGRWVFRDYDIGDWIGVCRYTLSSSNYVDPLRVMAITINVDSDANVTLELTLETLLDAKQKELEKRLTAIYNTVVNQPPIMTPAIPPAEGSTLEWNNDTAWTPVAPGEGGGGGGGTGPTVYVQVSEPSDPNVGDFWIELR